jgi:hypothetical protein
MLFVYGSLGSLQRLQECRLGAFFTTPGEITPKVIFEQWRSGGIPSRGPKPLNS